MGPLIGLGAFAPGSVQTREAMAAGVREATSAGTQEIQNMDWNAHEEDEADEVAMKSVRDAKINLVEAPKQS